MLREPRVENLLVSNGVDGGNDDVCRRDCVSLDVDGGDLGLPRRPLAGGYGDVEVDDRSSWTGGREFNGRLSSKEVSHLRSSFELRVSRERPDEIDEHPLGDVLFDLIEREREVRVLVVVLENVPDGLVDEGEEGVESSDLSEVHDVLDRSCELEACVDESIGSEEGFEDSDDGLLGSEIRGRLS